MLLYTEKQLDSAYRVDCRARTICNEPWILRESFRLIYETIVEKVNRRMRSGSY
jgi:hypothetical protein